MIRIENVEIIGWEHAIRGMRNPMNSWEKSDSCFGKDPCRCDHCDHLDWDCYERKFKIGPNDLDLMKRLRNAGTDHRKFMRMITVYADITAPLYWWKEFDTYKVGTVANSCSTMHKIHTKEFTLEDFSHEHLITRLDDVCDWDIAAGPESVSSPFDILNIVVDALNRYREQYLKTKDKKYWWQMIQLLPSSYNQKRTVMLNYEVLANIYKSRKNHKLDEWSENHIDVDGNDMSPGLGMAGFCDWIKTLPYSGLITGKETE